MPEPDLDTRLLAALSKQPLVGATALARSLGVDRSTVRRRWEDLEERGVLRGFTAYPAPPALDRVGLALGFDGGAASEALVPRAMAAPDTVWAATTLEGWLYVYSGTRDADATKARLAEHLGQAHDAEYTYRTASVRRPGRPEGFDPLGPLELRVMRALLPDPRRSLKELAEETGLTERTVAHHREGLLATRALEVYPILRTPHRPGRLFFHLTTTMRDIGVRNAVVQATGGVVVSEFTEPVGVYLFCTADNLMEQQAMFHRVRAMDGVLDAYVVMNRSYEVATPRLVAWVDEALAHWAKARRGA